MSYILTLLLVVVITSTAFSVVIRCDFRETSLVVVGTRYTCSARQLKNQEISEVTEIIGSHKTNRSNENVEVFFSHKILIRGIENSLLTFPKNLEKFFPNLVVVDIRNSRLTKIAAEDLAPWSNLTVLRLWGNKIINLDSNLFQHSPKLAWVNMQSNSIQHVGAGLLSNLNELRQVYFQNNPCINAFAETSQAIEELKRKLVAQCPPCGPRCETLSSSKQLTTTAKPTTTTILVTPTTISVPADSCSARCSLNEEVDSLRAAIEEQALTIHSKVRRIQELDALTNEQKMATEEQAQTSMEQSRRIEELSAIASEQRQTIDDQARRIERIETILRELSTNYC